MISIHYINLYTIAGFPRLHQHRSTEETKAWENNEYHSGYSQEGESKGDE